MRECGALIKNARRANGSILLRVARGEGRAEERRIPTERRGTPRTPEEDRAPLNTHTHMHVHEHTREVELNLWLHHIKAFHFVFNHGSKRITVVGCCSELSRGSRDIHHWSDVDVSLISKCKILPFCIDKLIMWLKPCVNMSVSGQ